MKSIIFTIIVCSTASHVFAQDETTTSAWSVSPSLTFVRNFQGETTASSAYEGFEANGFSVRARIFNNRTKSLALTLSGGVNWFSRAPRLITESNGVSSIRANEFTLFPLGAGLHVVFPYRSRDSFMLYGGIDWTLNFISGGMGISRQVYPGHTFMGGFAVGIFEFGVRYSSFSDIKNLGAHVGLRFKSFEL